MKYACSISLILWRWLPTYHHLTSSKPINIKIIQLKALLLTISSRARPYLWIFRKFYSQMMVIILYGLNWRKMFLSSTQMVISQKKNLQVKEWQCDRLKSLMNISKLGNDSSLPQHKCACRCKHCFFCTIYYFCLGGGGWVIFLNNWTQPIT